MSRRDGWPARAALRATGGAAADLVQLGPAPAFAPLDRNSAPERWGIVLGGGGVLGAAWLVGALGALESALGRDARSADLIVGTSAGSIVGALLAGGMPVAQQRADQLGERAATEALGDDQKHLPEVAARPPLPRLRPGSPALLRHNRGRLRQLPATAVLSGLAPAGTARMPGVGALIERVVPAGAWPQHDGLRVVALDYATGVRVQFGAQEAPQAGLSEAVLASCAIPGWFAPVPIAGRRYVDGGAWSSTNVDLAAGAGIDRLFVLAPMVSTAYDTPVDWRSRAERQLRIAITRRCLAEAREVHATGVPVTVIGPGPAELAMIGHNLMSARPRRDVLRSAEATVGTALRQLQALERA